MRDGATGAELCAWLNKHKAFKATQAAPINDQNITDWRGTGYAAWLKGHERAQHLREYTEVAQHIAAATGGDPTAVASRILTGKLLDMLEAVDEETADGMAKAVSALRKGENDSKKIDLENHKSKRDDEILALEIKKFRRSTCEMFMKWYQDKKAISIADGPGTNEDKIKALLDYMDKEEKA